MGTIKILGFDEDGNAQRLKIRIARFLDYDPVTASDKSNIRSTLGITSQGGLGDLLAANNLDDVASLDTTKANLEIPDVGTAPNQTPLNLHLGSLAYADADSVSVAELQVESTTGTATTQALTVTDGSSTNFVVQEDGSVGIGGTPNYALDVSGGSVSLDSDWPLYFGSSNAFIEGGTSGTKLRLNHSAGLNITNAGTTHATIDSSGNVSVPSGQVQVVSGAASAPSYAFDGDTDTGMSRPTTDAINFVTGGTERWRINASGNLVANGTAIDFGSGASTTLDDYEEGVHTTTMTPDTSGSITLYSTYDGLAYTKIGRSIIVTGQLQVSTVSSPVGSAVRLTLPTSTLDLGDRSGGFGAGVAYYNGSSWAPVSCACGESSNQLFVHVDASTVSADDQFRFSLCYQSA